MHMILIRNTLNKQPNNGKVTFPICEDFIINNTQDSIYCEGECNSWIHRCCAGLTKAALVDAAESGNSFLCPHCMLFNLNKEISLLKGTINNLTELVQSLQKSSSNTTSNTNSPLTTHQPTPSSNG